MTVSALARKYLKVLSVLTCLVDVEKFLTKIYTVFVPQDIPP